MGYILGALKSARIGTGAARRSGRCGGFMLGGHCEVVTWELYSLQYSTDGVLKKEVCKDREAEY